MLWSIHPSEATYRKIHIANDCTTAGGGAKGVVQLARGRGISLQECGGGERHRYRCKSRMGQCSSFRNRKGCRVDKGQAQQEKIFLWTRWSSTQPHNLGSGKKAGLIGITVGTALATPFSGGQDGIFLSPPD